MKVDENRWNGWICMLMLWVVTPSRNTRSYTRTIFPRTSIFLIDLIFGDLFHFQTWPTQQLRPFSALSWKVGCLRPFVLLSMKLGHFQKWPFPELATPHQSKTSKKQVVLEIESDPALFESNTFDIKHSFWKSWNGHHPQTDKYELHNIFVMTLWFLAVQNSSIGDLVPWSVCLSGTTNNQSLHNTTEWT